MPMPGYMQIDAESQGEIRGSSNTANCSECIEILAIDHLVELPVDRNQQLSNTVLARHHDITVIKPVDRSTPMLYQALCTREVLTKVRLEFYRPWGESGTSVGNECFYSIELENALITKLRPLEIHVLDEDMAHRPFSESVSFTYERIVWTWEDTGVSYEQEWTPMSGT